MMFGRKNSPAPAQPAGGFAAPMVSTPRELSRGRSTAGAALSSSWSNVWLIAKREVTTRLGLPSFRIMTLIMLVVVVGGILALEHFATTESMLRVGVTDSAAAPAIEQLAATNGLELEVLTIPSQADGEAQILDGSLDALVLGNPLTAIDLPVITEEALNPQLATLFNQLVSQSAFAREISALGGDPAVVAGELADVRVTVNSLNPPPPTNPAQMVTAIAMGALLYMAMVMGAQFVAQGVVEEKASRVVEVLLSTVRPWQLMAGKVIGIGLVTLGQLFLVLLAGFITARMTGIIAFSDLQLGTTLIWAAIWALVGFAIFAVVMAALAARVSRQEEVGSVTAPALMLMMIPYIFGISILPYDPGNEFGRILSYIPLFSSMLMPIRRALGVATTTEMLLALVIALLVLPLLVLLAGRLYSGAVLHTGSKVSMRTALKR